MRKQKSNKRVSNKAGIASRDFKSKNSDTSKLSGTDDNYNHDCNTGSGRFNDPEWYVNSEQILKDAARIPYSIPVGTCFTRDGKITQLLGVTLPSYDNAIPGLMASYLMPMLGPTDQSASAPVNVASNGLFQFVRSKISGTRRYEAVDMMIYMGAMDSIYCMITWLTRLYATAFTYHQSNKYLAKAIIEAQGVDFNELLTALPIFRQLLNVELSKIRDMYLPAVLPIFKRHSWMFSHYFIEGESEKDQIYFHVPAGYHVFTLDDDGKGMLKAVSIVDHPTLWKSGELIQMIRDMINPIFEREDFNIISGDMLKAYEGRVFTLTEVPDIATVQLAYSQEVLLQFKNAKYKNIPRNPDESAEWMTNFFDYRQDATGHLRMIGSLRLGHLPLFNYMSISNNDNVIETDMTTDPHKRMLSAVMYEWSKDTILTTPNHNVEPVENMINTRLTMAFDFIADANMPAGYDYDQLYFGSEWAVYYKLFTYHRNKSTGNITLFSRTYDRTLSILETDFKLWIESQSPIRSSFKFVPELSLMPATTTGYAEVPGRSLFEVDNYAVISQLTIGGLHNAAILGEYNIPNLSLGK